MRFMAICPILAAVGQSTAIGQVGLGFLDVDAGASATGGVFPFFDSASVTVESVVEFSLSAQTDSGSSGLFGRVSEVTGSSGAVVGSEVSLQGFVTGAVGASLDANIELFVPEDVQFVLTDNSSGEDFGDVLTDLVVFTAGGSSPGQIDGDMLGAGTYVISINTNLIEGFADIDWTLTLPPLQLIPSPGSAGVFGAAFLVGLRRRR
ncbi:MAG: hypothetical protein AAF235_01915 [Planctomycetota bacterium]